MEIINALKNSDLWENGVFEVKDTLDLLIKDKIGIHTLKDGSLLAFYFNEEKEQACLAIDSTGELDWKDNEIDFCLMCAHRAYSEQPKKFILFERFLALTA